MEAKDLRIGNLLADKDGDIFELSGFYLYQLSIEENKNGCIESHLPIPLTEEWLLKFGFIKKLGNYELENFRFHVNKPMNYDGFLFCEGYSVITDRINFVHQLQNLYFALTNEELKLNL